MKQLKQWIYSLLYPSSIWWILTGICSFSMLVMAFLSGFEESIFNYISYVISAYSLIISILKVPMVITEIKRVIYNNKYGNRYINEFLFRTEISLYASLIINIVFASFNFYVGVTHKSIWFGTIGIYYLILSIIRFSLLYSLKRRSCDSMLEWKRYKISGILLFSTNVVLSGMVIQMVSYGQGYQYPGYLIYVMAIYVFYNLMISIINVVKYRNYDNPILIAAKILDFSTALVSILSLQTAMFVSFGEGDLFFSGLMNSIFGSIVCLSIFLIAFRMIQKANRKIDCFYLEKEN